MISCQKAKEDDKAVNILKYLASKVNTNKEISDSFSIVVFNALRVDIK